MRKTGSVSTYVWACLALLLAGSRAADAAFIYVPAGGDVQAALNAATGGDIVLLATGATFVGNFKLPVHGGTGYVIVRTAVGNSPLPAPRTRITPASSPYLAKLKSGNNAPVLRTAPGAAYWRLELLEITSGAIPSTTLVELGDGSSAQNLASQVPHHLIMDRLYVHGDPRTGQKRAFGLNSGDTTISASYVADIKAIARDSQAIAGWNGPGPYRIENNYLESAGTSVLFGGDDPKIPGLVPGDVIFRDNTVTRPIAWRNAIMATPAGARASFTAGGSLPAATYAYRVVARRMIESAPVTSAASAEVSVTAGAGSVVTVQWNAVPDATEYLVYGRTAGTQNRYWIVKGTTFNDDGLVTSASGTPAAATVWQVKNLFELKNARRVQVDHNLFSNNWAQAQTGTAILFTTRNQGGNCAWCVVEDVSFEHNVVHSVGAGFQVTGWDNLKPSLQGHHIAIRHNLIADLSKSWGGKGYLATITDGARDLTFDHNTIVSPDGSGIIMADGIPIQGFVFTNNLARHNTYGITGSGYAPGNGAIGYYFPNGVVTRNAIAGGSASAYPAGNDAPSVAGFESHFANYPGGDYALVAATNWQAWGTDGTDLGADMTRLAGAGSPSAPPATVPPAAVVAPLQITTTSLPSATEGAPYQVTLSAVGGVPAYSWNSSALAPGLTLNVVSGRISGSPLIAGDYVFTVQVIGADGTTRTQPLSIHVNPAIPPVDILTSVINTMTATLPFAQALDATGGLGTYRWSATGTLPAGVSLSAAGVLAGTPLLSGTYPVVLSATDTQDASRSASRTLAIFVAPPPNHRPTVSWTSPANGATARTGSTLTLTASAADVDGNLSRVDFYLDTTFLGSSTGPAFAQPWTVAAPGAYQFTAVAVDDRGDTATSTQLTINATPDVVLYASDVAAMSGNYELAIDGTAAGGMALWNPDRGAAKVTTALAAPASYADFTFDAEAGRPYHLWIRGRAQKNAYTNDSAFVQFSGVAGARIGSTGSMTFVVEETTGAGVSGWGWEDNGWGAGTLGADVMFDTTGRQTIRIQPREDGLYIDQIVLSPQQFLSSSPGAQKNDTTILAR